MSEDKTFEELQKEYDALKKANLEREIAIEKAKLAEAEDLKKKDAEEKFRRNIETEVREKLLKEMSQTSNLSTGNATSQRNNGVVEQFKADFLTYANNELSLAKERGDAPRSTKTNFSGRSYEQIVKDLKNGIKRGEK